MRRTIPYVAAWFAAGVAAVAIAGAGVGMVSRQVTGNRPAPLSAEEVRDELAAGITATSTTVTTAPSPTPTTAASPTTSITSPSGGGPGATTTTPPPAPTTRTYDMVGGTATLRFSPAGVDVVTATPRAGFSVETESAHGTGVKVEFEGNDHKSRVEGWWDGGPRDEVREDD